MEASKYLGQFADASRHFKLFGAKLLVEKMDPGEVKTAGGLILSAPSHVKGTVKAHEPLVLTVLAVGEGYTNDEGTPIPLTVKPGNIIVCNANGVSFFSTLPGVPSYTEMKVGITTETDVQLLFADANEFDAYTKAFTIPATTPANVISAIAP